MCSTCAVRQKNAIVDDISILNACNLCKIFAEIGLYLLFVAVFFADGINASMWV